MTTPTTPAADSFDAWYEALPSMAMPEREFALFVWNTATARESALVAERDALRAAMDHIAKTCLASRSQSRRIRWIEARARGALLGQNDLHRMIDLPKDGGPATAEKLQRRIVHERHMHNITNGLTAGILGAALAAPAVEGV